MRCLQCGKAIPLLKRLGGGSEFCSDAHRREYQHEFSQLALGRLLQSQPPELQRQQAPALTSATVPVVDAPAALQSDESQPPAAPPATIQKPAAAGLQLAPMSALEFEHAIASLALDRPRCQAETLLAELPHGRAFPLERGVEIAQWIARGIEHKLDLREMSRPASRVALDLRIVPPESLERESEPLAMPVTDAAPVEAPLWIGAHCGFVGELVSLSDFADAQFSQSDFEPAVLAGRPGGDTLEPAIIGGGPGVTIFEPTLIVGEPGMATFQPTVIAGRPGATTFQPTAIAGRPRAATFQPIVIAGRPATAPIQPAANASKPGVAAYQPAVLAGSPGTATFESRVVAGSTAPALAEPRSVGSQPGRIESGTLQVATQAGVAASQVTAPIPAMRIPDPELHPVALDSAGIAPGRAKPLPVFGPALVGTGTVQIPQPAGLPLRPVMVRGKMAVPVAGVKAEVRPRPALSITAEIQQSTTSAAPSSELNLGLPELRMDAPAGLLASRTNKILAAVAGVAVLGLGIFFFAGKPSDAGSKSPAPAAAVDAPSGQWITNFAPDAKRQRRVSLLRSSMNLSAYRLDFESSIRLKALGWVYRAQDSKNFYVSKIEFQKPGVNPVYVLVHYAVINGVEQARAETPLHVTVPMGGLYKIRFEAVGNRFTTWVQGQQVEQWTDPRLSRGGAGLYGEGSEQSVLHGEFGVTPLSN